MQVIPNFAQLQLEGGRNGSAVEPQVLKNCKMLAFPIFQWMAYEGMMLCPVPRSGTSIIEVQWQSELAASLRLMN
jgi:hypothetical protein